MATAITLGEAVKSLLTRPDSWGDLWDEDDDEKLAAISAMGWTLETVGRLSFEQRKEIFELFFGSEMTDDQTRKLIDQIDELAAEMSTTTSGEEWTSPEYKKPGKRLLAHLEDTTTLSIAARFVARVLLDHYSPQNYAFPKQETLAHLCGCSVRTVSRALQELVEAKVLRVVKPYQYGERYAPTVYDFTAKTKKAMDWQ